MIDIISKLARNLALDLARAAAERAAERAKLAAIRGGRCRAEASLCRAATTGQNAPPGKTAPPGNSITADQPRSDRHV